MKTLNKAILALGASSVLAMSANAAISHGTSGDSSLYVGAKAGQIDVKSKPKANAYGMYAGYNFDNHLGAEIEYLGSSDTKYQEAGADREYKAKTYGAYGVYNYQFGTSPVYAKGKLGVAKTDIDAKGVNFTESKNTTGVAGGAAIGATLAGVNLEAGYNYLNSDANMWTVGAHLKF